MKQNNSIRNKQAKKTAIIKSCTKSRGNIVFLYLKGLKMIKGLPQLAEDSQDGADWISLRMELHSLGRTVENVAYLGFSQLGT